MTDQPDTPEPTEQEAADAFYASIYGQPQSAELSADDQDFYNHIFPTK